VAGAPARHQQLSAVSTGRGDLNGQILVKIENQWKILVQPLVNDKVGQPHDSIPKMLA